MDQDSITLGKNGRPFEEGYWKDIYGSGCDIDASYNAKEHARYLKSLFDLMEFPVRSIMDFGFGKGLLLKAMVKEFQPNKILAIDPSEVMLDELLKKPWIRSHNISILNETIEILDDTLLKQSPYKLGICNSVVQYISGDLGPVFQKMHSLVDYLYFSVPTDKDYKRMEKELQFTDPYAYARSRSYYRKKISKYFRFVSWNVLESKRVEKSPFNDELFVN